MSRSDLDLITELLDAVEQTDDFVSGVLGLQDGRLGGDVAEGQSWLARRLVEASFRFQLGRGGVAAGLAASYGPEQLRKAAVEARRLASVVDELDGGGACPQLVARLDELGARRLAGVLSALGPRSPELPALHRSLTSMRGVLAQARVERILGRRTR